MQDDQYVCSLFILHHVNPMDLPLNTKVVFKPYQTLYSDVHQSLQQVTQNSNECSHGMRQMSLFPLINKPSGIYAIM